MNETEAKKLTERIVGTWPASPKGFVWTEELLPLDASTAHAAVTRLVREHEESRLPIARFLAVYRAIDKQNHPRRHDTVAHDDGPTMSFDEYIATLIHSANAGDTDATRMLDLWADNEHRGLISSWLVKP